MLFVCFSVGNVSPAFAQQNQTKYEWHIEFWGNPSCDKKDFYYDVDSEGQETTVVFDVPDAIFLESVVISVNPPTAEVGIQGDSVWECWSVAASQPTYPNTDWFLTAHSGDTGDLIVNQTISPMFFVRVNVRRGREIKMADFCEIIIPVAGAFYNSQQHINRIKNRSIPQIDINLIGDYEIPVITSLPIKIGTYQTAINLGGLRNLRYFFYSMIMWRTFFKRSKRR